MAVPRRLQKRRRLREAMYCTKGSGTLIIGGKRYTIEPLTAFVIPAGVPHKYYTNGDAWDTHWVIPSGYACEDTLKQLGFEKPVIFPANDIKYLEHCFRKIHEAVSADKLFGNFHASGYLYDFLIELYRIRSVSGSSSAPGPVLTAAIDYIEIHFRGNITLEALCETAGVSKQHLCRLFRESLGCRPMEYIAKRRIRLAKELISSTDKTIEQIAEEVGFCDSSYFCRQFHRYEGMTPGQFKG